MTRWLRTCTCTCTCIRWCIPHRAESMSLCQCVAGPESCACCVQMTPCQRCVGIELSNTRHAHAQRALEEAKASTFMYACRYVCTCIYEYTRMCTHTCTRPRGLCPGVSQGEHMRERKLSNMYMGNLHMRESTSVVCMYLCTYACWQELQPRNMLKKDTAAQASTPTQRHTHIQRPPDPHIHTRICYYARWA